RERVDTAAREQGGDDFEARILRRRANQTNVALLDVGQKRVLLRFVKAMDLIDEDDGSRAEIAGFRGVCHHLLDFFDSAENSGELDEVGLGYMRNDLCQGGFSHTGRTPEDDRPR